MPMEILAWRFCLLALGRQLPRNCERLVNASLQYLGIAFSFAWGVLLFDDPVHPLALLGMVMVIGAGIAATRLRHAGAAPRQNASDTLPPDLES